jgi:hypothetical protein
LTKLPGEMALSRADPSDQANDRDSSWGILQRGADESGGERPWTVGR